MVQNGLLKKVLRAFGLSAISVFSVYGQYKTVEVNAPFPMNPIKEFVYPKKDFSITEFGAANEGTVNNTEAITKAITACHKAGGGRVVVPEGEWLTGPIHLKSNVNLHLAEGAILRFTDNPSDYLPPVMTSWEGMECYNYSPLVYAFDCENVAITGKGVLMPKMDTWKIWFARPQAHMDALKDLYTQASTDVPVVQRQMASGENHLRPHLIHFNRCKNVLLDGFKIRESPFWTIHLYLCDGGIVRNLDVRAHGHNNDGIDLEMTRNFLVENCTFDQGDDAVVIKAGRNRDAWRLNTPSENIVIRHCNILEGHTLLGIGSEISGGIRNVYMHDCKAPKSVRRLFFVKTNHRRGAFVENIYMENIRTGHVRRVLEIDTDVLYQWKELVPTYEERITRIDGIYLKNVSCDSADAVYELKGDPKLPVRNVFIENVHVEKVNDFVKKICHVENVQERNVTIGNRVVHNGIPWFDEQGNIVNAHGACIVEDGGRYWLFGEYKSDESNAFPGFGCYSSVDLVNWKFEHVVLPVQKDGILGPNRVGERVKVMKCPKTGEYVMLMHADDMGYNDPYIGIATSKTINGDYTLHGPILFNGKPIKRWDMGTFQDTDGKGYLLIHHGPIYRLSDDYRSVEAEVAYVEGMGESPAMFKKNGMYYLLTSNLTSWERNDNFYFTASSIEGPWERQGIFCPEGSLTWNSQSTYVFPLKQGNDTIPMYMGDRWSYPHQASAATCVWLPLQVEGKKLSIPEYWPSWNVDRMEKVEPEGTENVQNWSSDRKGDCLRIPFTGSHVAIVGETNCHGGYAKVSIRDKNGKTVHSSLVDFYSKVPDKAVRFISRKMPVDAYTLEIEVTGEQPVWYDKRKNRFGSDGYRVNVEKVCIFPSFTLTSGRPVSVSMDAGEKPVVHTALELLSRDLKNVLDCPLRISQAEGDILVGTIGQGSLPENTGIDLSVLKGKKQAFILATLPDGRLLIAGSDSHGTAYGIMELSRLLGVSPWEWWADVTPEKKISFRLPVGYQDMQQPSVEYRGIFINDEDWGLMPWSSLHYEPWYKPGRIGPRTNERIFELLLRLRANTYWPAMHECTQPFFLTKGNREVAKKFGIYIGGSHCEPMASSTAGEWPRRGKGDYDYVNNSTSVCRFWEDRVKEVDGQEILYTVGMRGVHDGAMNGARTVEEQKAVLSRVFTDQRRLLQQYVDEDVTKVPQVFIPYKEVLDVYNAGLQVPEDVTLMWCDDNYGYIKHFPTPEERIRKGGNGIYYHVSYWGRPHDYLWLGTSSPYLLHQQMKLAYERGIQRMWILNVGDIKPAEYQIELFMDMAWNMEKVTEEGVSSHLGRFLCREFGDTAGRALLPVMEEHYRLAYIRKPEFMGNTREEEYHTNAYRIVKDMPWSKKYILQRLEDYKQISDRAEQIAASVNGERADAYFQLVKYPVQAAAEMNKKMLYAQFARHEEMAWNRSDAAYDSIVSLTRIYNIGIRNNGKWHRIMDHQPHRLPVFEPVDRTVAKESMPEDRPVIFRWNASECTKGHFIPCEGLGYEGKSAAIIKGKDVTFEFFGCPSDSVEVEVCLLPSHPVEGTQLRFTVALGGKETSPVHYETQGRSEEWKENVLRNQAIRRVILPARKKKTNKLVIKALDEGVVLDQVSVYPL